MNSMSRWVLIFVIIACAATAFFFLSNHKIPQQRSIFLQQLHPSPDNAPASSTTESEILTRHPVPEPEARTGDSATPLPALEYSDDAIQESLDQVSDATRLGELLVFKNFINRLVVTIDNLPRSKLPLQHLPSKAPHGKFLAKKAAGGETVIDPENYKRYTTYVRFFEELDARKVVAVYFHFYPLFQEAYRDLGYKSGNFNDRLIDSIDDLLSTPDVRDPVKLVQPSVFYKFADTKLESLSAGKRLMIRIGYDNAAKVKTKLRELRKALTSSSPDE